MNTWFRRLLAWPWRHRRLPASWIAKQNERNEQPGRTVRHYPQRKDL